MLMNEMTKQECREALEYASFGRLGCSLANQPYIVPVYLAYESDCIYVFSTFGKKIEWMRANPKVCIQIDEIAEQYQWMSVIVNGRYEELPELQYAESVRMDHRSITSPMLGTFEGSLNNVGVIVVSSR